MRLLVLNGPNLNRLGSRDPAIYGTVTLDGILERMRQRAAALGVELRAFQSNHEGALIDFLQAEAGAADGIIINAGALSHYGLSLQDALAETHKLVIDVHISNIYRREPHRHHSIIAEVARGQITGLGWRGYLAALDVLHDLLQEEHSGEDGAVVRETGPRDTVA